MLSQLTKSPTPGDLPDKANGGLFANISWTDLADKKLSC